MHNIEYIKIITASWMILLLIIFEIHMLKKKLGFERFHANLKLISVVSLIEYALFLFIAYISVFGFRAMP